MGWIFETATFPLIGRAHTHREERERDGDDVEAGRDLGPRGRLRGARAHQERCRDQVQPHPRCASRLARSPFFLPSLPPPQQQPRSRPRVVGKGRERRLTTRSLFRALVQAPGGRGTCRSPRTTTPSTRTRRSTSPSCSPTEGSSQVSRASRIAPHRIDDGGGS